MNFFLTFEYEKLQRHIKTSKGQLKEEKGNISTYLKSNISPIFRNKRVIYGRVMDLRKTGTLHLCTTIDQIELSCNK